MINKTPNQNFSLSIHASVHKWLLLIVPHLVAFMVVLGLMEISLILSLAILVGIILSFLYFLRLHIFQNLEASVKAIYQDSRNNWFLINFSGEDKNVELQAETFVSNYLLILNFVDNKKKNYSVILTPDSVSKDKFRQLKVIINTQ